MAVTGVSGYSRVIRKRRFDDYASLKQYYQNSNLEEVIISGDGTTGGAAAEISFVTGDAMMYIAAEGDAYIRCEADDANQHSKYVYLQYQDDTGAVQDWVTANLDGTNSTTEVKITGTGENFYRIRQMYSEVESASGGGKMIILTDADMGGADDEFGFISDGHSEFALERFFTQPDSTHKSFLGRVECWAPIQDGDSAAAGFACHITYTPKPNSQGAEAAVAADVTTEIEFSDHFVWEPCIELDGGTEVIFKLEDFDTAATIHLEAILLEVDL
jgi:hypothetical protein